MEHRAVWIDGGRLVSTALPPASHLVRLHPGDADHYDRLVVVSEMDEGRTLFLSGWIEPEQSDLPPLTHNQWRQAKAGLFPAARLVRFERRKGDRVKMVQLTV